MNPNTAHHIMRNLLPPETPQEHRQLAYLVEKNRSNQAQIRRSITRTRENLARIEAMLTDQETNLANLAIDAEHLERLLRESPHG